MSYFFGLDISKDSFDVSVFSEDKGSYKRKYDMTKAGFLSFLSYLKTFEGEIMLFMEPTGEYYINLANYLIYSGYSVYLVNQFNLKNFIKSSTLRRTKTDKKDSYWISKFGKDNYMNLKKYIPSNSLKLDDLLRLKENLIREMSAYKTKIKSKLNVSFPELVNNYDVFGSFYSSIVSKYPSAYSFGNINIDDFLSMYPAKLKANFLKSVYELSKNSCSTIKDDYDFAIKIDFSILFEYQKQLEFLDKEIDILKSEFLIFTENVKILTSIEGVGEDSAVKLISFSNINNFDVGEVFKDSAKWSAYCGTEPIIFESGSSVRGGSRISKRGSKHLRTLAFKMSMNLIKYNTVFRDYYDKKKGSNNNKGKKYLFAVWNKFLRVAYHLLSTHQYYKKT